MWKPIVLFVYECHSFVQRISETTTSRITTSRFVTRYAFEVIYIIRAYTYAFTIVPLSPVDWFTINYLHFIFLFQFHFMIP